jgi:outer membrane protein assembly factor BamB
MGPLGIMVIWRGYRPVFNSWPHCVYYPVRFKGETHRMPCLKPALMLALVFATLAALSSPVARGGFDTVEETPGLSNQLQVLALEVQGGSSDAVGRLNELWSGNGAGVVKQEDGSIVTIAGWVEGLAADQLAKLRDAFDSAGIGQVLPVTQVTASSPASTPMDLYAKARGTAVSSEVGPALAIAGDRARAWGDSSTAADLYSTAAAYGWTPTVDAAALIKSSATGGTSQPASATMMPVPVAWYGQPERLSSPRVLPVEAPGGVTFVGGIAGVLAARGNQVLWTNTWGEAPDIAAGVMLPGGAGRGTMYMPAVLAGMGQPQVVVVNTPVTADLPGTLRAIRATDGKTLWETTTATPSDASSLDPMVGLRYVGPVTIAGRYVYAQAVRLRGTWSALNLVCLDVMTGRPLWAATLGNVIDTARNDARRPLEYHWHASAPVVAGDRVYVAPGVGYVFGVGRFDGLLRWARPYEAANAPEAEILRFREQLRNRGAKVQPPIHPLQAMRWAGQLTIAGDILIAAPLDIPGVLALDVRTGKVKWSKPEIDGPNLVGASSGVAIFSGTGLRAIDVASGADKWTTDPAQATPTGPATLVGEVVHVPVEGDVLRAFDVATGKLVNERPSTFAPQRAAIAPQLTAIGAVDGLIPPAPTKK